MGLILAAAGPLEHDPDGLRRTARDLLARPPFTPEEPGPVTDLLLRVRSWIAGVLDAVFAAVVGNDVLAWAVVGAATAAVVALALRWGRHVRREPDRATSVVGRTGRSADAWLAEADGHADAGEWEAAIRCAYLGLVRRLVEDGLVPDSHGLTVGEIDRAVANTVPGRAERVVAAGRAFEDSRYGHRPADERGYRTVLAAVERGPVAARG